MTAPPFILASTSQSRRTMLDAAGIAYEAIAPAVDEAEIKRALSREQAPARAVADTLAEAKALKISRRHPAALVLGSDQILETHDGRLLDKASDRDELRAQLLGLRGQAHKLISAAVMAEDGKSVWRHIDVARLWVRDFSKAWLDDYLESEGDILLAGVGGYRIEGRGAQLFSRIVGDQFVIRGLPLLSVIDYLRIRGVLST